MKPNLPRLRQRISTTMTMHVLIYREGPIVTDPDTLQDMPSRITVWQGRALIYPQTAPEQQVIVASAVYQVSTYDAVLPCDATFKTGDHLEVTASPDNATMVGKTFVVRDDPLDGWQIARRAVLRLVD